MDEDKLQRTRVRLRELAAQRRERMGRLSALFGPADALYFEAMRIADGGEPNDGTEVGMREKRITPGPWRTNVHGYEDTMVVGAEGRPVCSTGGFQRSGLPDGGRGENGANASAIAALPEMVLALEMAEDVLGDVLENASGIENAVSGVRADEALQAVRAALCSAFPKVDSDPGEPNQPGPQG